LKARVVCGCIVGSRSQQRRFTRRKGCQLALSFQRWSVVWVTLTIAQSSTKPSHKGLPTDGWIPPGHIVSKRVVHRGRSPTGVE